MKQAFIILMCLLVNAGMAQVFSCGGWIGPNAVVVNSTMDLIRQGGKVYWVCSGGELILRGCGGSTIYAETGGKVYLDNYTGGSNINLKKGAVLEAYNGVNNIYFEPGAVFNVAGNLYPCPVMKYDYRWAPANGCAVTPTTRESSESSGSFGANSDAVSVIKTEDGVSLKFYNPLGEMYGLELFDIQGKVIKSMNIYTEGVKIDKEDFQPGLYFFRLQNASGIQHQGKFVIK